MNLYYDSTITNTAAKALAGTAQHEDVCPDAGCVQSTDAGCVQSTDAGCVEQTLTLAMQYSFLFMPPEHDLSVPDLNDLT